jgi:hypothetical protein
MDPNLPENQITCTQCGGELHPDEGQIFLTCPYCGSEVYLDKSKVVFHWYLAPTLDESKARGALARWMAGNQTVKDLDQKSKVTEVSFEYFPVWFFKRQMPGGREGVALVPAAATAVSEIRSLRLPAGDLRKYTSDIETLSHAPSVPLQTALAWVEAGNGVQTPVLAPGGQPAGSGGRGPILPPVQPRGMVVEQSLVHIPLYTFKYAFNGHFYTAVVEGATGEVFANIYPAKAEAPYLAIGMLTALVFLCLATFPVMGAASNNSDGAIIGLGACAGAAIIAAPILFGLAAWVAAKI